MVITILMLIIIILFYCYINNKIKEGFKPTLYKLDPSQKIYTSILDCDKYCSRKNCLKMRQRLNIINKCLECKKKGLCLNKTILTPKCTICNKSNNKSCFRDTSYTCPNPNNIYSLTRSKPYFLINKEFDNVNSSTSDTCNFCWNL